MKSLLIIRDRAMKEKRSQLNNADGGFTLLELLVVILVMAVVAGAMVIGVSGIMRSSEVRAAKVLTEGISDGRTAAMSRVEGTVAVKISKDSGGYYVETVIGDGSGDYEENGDARELCNSNLSVSAVTGSTSAEIGEESPLYLTFDKGSGAFKGSVPDCIRITRNDSFTDVVLVKDTGRAYREKDEG